MSDASTSFEKQIKAYIADAQGVEDDNSDLHIYEKGYLRGLKHALHIVEETAGGAIIAEDNTGADPTKPHVFNMSMDEKAREICSILSIATSQSHICSNGSGFTTAGLSAVLQKLRNQNNGDATDE